MRVASLLAVALTLAGATPEASGRIHRYAILIGNNVGDARDTPLRYAEDDADKLRDVLQELGDFPPENVALLQGRDARTIRRSIIVFNDRIRASMAGPQVQAVLLVYYSGHADANALHVGSDRLDLAELEHLVRGSAATFRLLIVDSCRSGAITRVKGGASIEPFSIKLDARLAGQGVAFLTSSSATEDAQESDEIKGSFFTHYLVSGLVGAADRDRDGRVSLEEAYDHAYHHTLRASSRTFAGIQHPTFSYELRGRGDLILTALRPSRARGFLRFPAGRTYLVMQGGEAGRVLAEIGANDRVRQVSVEPGLYFVLGRGSDFLLEGTVAAQAGRDTLVDDGRLKRFAYGRLVRKGAGIAGVAHGPELAYRVRSPLDDGTSYCHGLMVGYGLDLAQVNVATHLELCRDTSTNDVLEAQTTEGALGVRLSHARDLPWLTVEVGVGAGGALLRQTFATTGVAPPRSTAAGFLEAGLRVVHDLPRGLHLFAGVGGRTYFLRRWQMETGGEPSALFAVDVAFGLGLRWFGR